MAGDARRLSAPLSSSSLPRWHKQCFSRSSCFAQSRRSGRPRSACEHARSRDHGDTYLRGRRRWAAGPRPSSRRARVKPRRRRSAGSSWWSASWARVGCAVLLLLLFGRCPLAHVGFRASGGAGTVPGACWARDVVVWRARRRRGASGRRPRRRRRRPSSLLPPSAGSTPEHTTPDVTQHKPHAKRAPPYTTSLAASCSPRDRPKASTAPLPRREPSSFLRRVQK